MKKPYRQADGFYHVDGKKYKTLFGSREQVMNGTVHKTTGGLTKADLVMNKWGRIVSAKKFKTAKKEMRLQKHGFFAKKGKFGAITRKFRGGDSDDAPAANTGASTTAAVPTTPAASTTAAPAANTAANVVATPATGANGGAAPANAPINTGASTVTDTTGAKKKTRSPVLKDKDGYPINIRKSNKKKSSPKSSEEKINNRI